MKIKTRILAGLALTLTSCTTIPHKDVQDFQNEERVSAVKHVAGWVARRNEYIQSHPEIPDSVVHAIKTGDLLRGMNQEQVVLSWRTPDRINTTGVGGLVQWVYEDRGSYVFATEDMYRAAGFGPPEHGTFYVYFRDGVLVDWQMSLSY